MIFICAKVRIHVICLSIIDKHSSLDMILAIAFGFLIHDLIKNWTSSKLCLIVRHSFYYHIQMPFEIKYKNDWYTRYIIMYFFCFCKKSWCRCVPRGAFLDALLIFKYLLVCIKRTQAAISGGYFFQFLSCFTSRDNLLFLW